MSFAFIIDVLSLRPEGAGLVCKWVYEHPRTRHRRAPQSSYRENAGTQDDRAARIGNGTITRQADMTRERIPPKDPKDW